MNAIILIQSFIIVFVDTIRVLTQSNVYEFFNTYKLFLLYSYQ